MFRDEANSINRAIVQCDGEFLSRYFDIDYIDENKEKFSAFADEKVSSMINDDFWRNAITPIFMIPKATTDKKKFNLYSDSVMVLVRAFKDLDCLLSTPVMKCMANTLRYFAFRGLHDDSGTLLQKMFSLYHHVRVCGKSPKLCIANVLVSVHFMRNNFKLAWNILNMFEESGVTLTDFEESEVTEYHFNKGKVETVFCRIEEAQKDLQYALDSTPLSEHKDRRLILAYLLPVQICCGMLPSRQLIDSYNLQLYQKFADSVRLADPNMFEEALDEHQLELIKLGQLDVILKIKNIIYLRILKMVHDINGKTSIETEMFQKALNAFQPFGFFETEALITTLVKEGYVKAIIANQMTVFPKEKAFPFFEN